MWSSPRSWHAPVVCGTPPCAGLHCAPLGSSWLKYGQRVSTPDPGTPTAHAISPDSGRHWSDPGAWPAAPGVHRIPLPLPMDGLRAVNVYAVEADDGLVLIDGGWAIDVARELLDQSLRSIGSGFGDIRRFLVTHVHRDHFTLATVLGQENGIDVALGRDEEPALDWILSVDHEDRGHWTAALGSAGAIEVGEQWVREEVPPLDPKHWAYPTTWLDGDQQIEVGGRSVDAVHTPGHTPGHFVFADRAAELLFAGDHVLSTITPSIGFTMPQTPLPLGDYIASLTTVRALPDLQLLPAHGPVAPSSHARIDALLAHHEQRLAESLAAVPVAPGYVTADDVARTLGWTRRLRAYDELDVFNKGMAAMETKAHLELLVARGQARRAEAPDGVRFSLA